MQCLWVIRLVTVMAVSLFLVLTSGEFPVNQFQIKIGKKVEGFRFRFITKVSFKQCMEECRCRPLCTSFYYARRFLVCELCNHSENDLLLTDAKGYVFVKVRISYTNSLVNVITKLLHIGVNQICAVSKFNRNQLRLFTSWALSQRATCAFGIPRPGI